MSVLVFGGRGFIGSQVVRRLIEAGVRPLVPMVAGRPPGRLQDVLDRIDLVRSVDDSPSALDDAVKGRAIVAAVDAAWLSQRPAMQDDPANREAEARLCRRASWIATRNARVWIGFGSCAEYGPGRSAAMSEADPLDPRSEYAKSKISAWSTVSRELGKALRLVWLRPFYVYGPGDHPHRLVPDAARVLASGGRYVLRNPAQQLDFVDVRDVARATVELLEVSHSGPVNIGSGHTVTVLEMVTRIADLVGAHGRIDSAPGEPAPRVCADTRLLDRALGWTPAPATGPSVAQSIAPWIR